jgi:hypothetical protein
MPIVGHVRRLLLSLTVDANRNAPLPFVSYSIDACDPYQERRLPSFEVRISPKTEPWPRDEDRGTVVRIGERLSAEPLSRHGS